MPLESEFQRNLIREIQGEYPGAVILKNDPSYIQAIPDWIILNGPRWAALEIKRSKNAPYQPNQKYYIGLMNHMSFAKAVYPENREDVLYALQRALRP